jgi:hypothetical protein
MNKEILQLKLQKRITEERLFENENKMDRLGEIIAKKTNSSPAFFSLADLQQKKGSTIEDRKILSNGMTLGELRIPLKGGKKALAAPELSNKLSAEPVPITNKLLLEIREHNLILANGKPEVRKLMKAREDEAARKAKKEKIKPKVKIPESMLPNRYIRGELPCTIEHGAEKYLSWACPLENLDYEYYLPLFFDGLQCDDMVVGFIARKGIEDMLYASKGSPERIKAVIPALVGSTAHYDHAVM